MWLQVNMIDETEKVTPVWSLSSANLQADQWLTGKVKLVSKDNADRYRVNTRHPCNYGFDKETREN
jgi:hypothetical protein